MKKLLKKSANSPVRDAFRVEPLEPRVLLSADPIFGVAQALMPHDVQHDHVALDAYQGSHSDALAHPALHFEIPATTGEHHTEHARSTLLTAASRPAFSVDQHAFSDASVAQRQGFMDGALAPVSTDAASLGVTVPASVAGTLAADSSPLLQNTQSYAAVVATPVITTPLITPPLITPPVIATPDPQDLLLTAGTLANLHNAAGQIVIGNDQSNAHIVIGESDAATALVLHDSLLLTNPALGGEIAIKQDLTLDNGAGLYIHGSGHTTTISASQVSASTININDSIKINGGSITDHTVSLMSTSGDIQLGGSTTQALNGDTAGTAATSSPSAPASQPSAINKLTLSSSGNILVYGSVGNTAPLQGFAITSANNVTFDNDVTLAGDLNIHATGTVTFDHAVHLTAGALHITGASAVVFKEGVIVDGGGDIYLEANAITFQGGAHSVTGSGILTLRPSIVGMNIELAGPPQQNPSYLDIDNQDIAALGSSFSKIVIGRQGSDLHADPLAGAVRIGAIQQAQSYTFQNALEVYGGKVEVDDFNNAAYVLQVHGNLTLDANQGISLYNLIEASGSNLVLYSATGAVTQSDPLSNGDGVSSEPLRALDLHVQAATGISLPWAQINTLTALNTGSGDLAVNVVARDNTYGLGGAIDIMSVSQSSPSGHGNISLSTSAGKLTLDTVGSGVSTAGSGAISLTAGGASQQMVINHAISGSGAISLSADGSVTLAAAIADSGSGTVSLTSTSANIVDAANIVSAGGAVKFSAGTSILMGDGVSINANDTGSTHGAVSMNAGTSITVSIIDANSGITLTALGGAIVDGLTGDGLNLDGDNAVVTLTAATGIGSANAPLMTRIAALTLNDTVSGGAFINEATALLINKSSVNGTLSIVTANGGIEVDGAITSAGNVLLQTGNTPPASTAPAVADLLIKANLTASTGNISLLSLGQITVDDGVSTSAPVVKSLGAGNTIELNAAGAITFEAQAQLQSAGGNVRLDNAAGDISVSTIAAGTGNVSISTAGSINEAAALTDRQAASANLPGFNISAASLRLSAVKGIGSAANALTTQVTILAAVVTSGSAYVTEKDGVSLGAVAPVAVNRAVVIAGSPAQASDSGVLNGLVAYSAVLNAGGNLTLDQAVTMMGTTIGSGNILLNAAGTLDINAPLLGIASGNISVLAAGNITQALSGSISSSGGSIDVASSTGNIVMANGALTQSNAGAIRYSASGSVTVGLLDARTKEAREFSSLTDQSSWGAVSIVAGGSIVDQVETPVVIDVYASQLRLNAGATIGSTTNALETEVATLSANAKGTGLYLLEASDIILGQTAALSVNRVDSTGATAVLTDSAQAGLTSGGALVLQTTSGSITSISGNGVISAAGNVLLQAMGSNASVTLNANLVSSAGNVSLNAAQDIVQNANITAQASGMSLDLLAGGKIAMNPASTSATLNGDILLQAGSDLTLAVVNAGSGSVSLNAASGSITNASSASSVTANGLQLNAGIAIGATDSAINTTVTTLTAATTAAAASGIFVTDTDGLSVGSVTVSVKRVDATGAATAASSGAHSGQSGLVSSAGPVVLISKTGNLTIDGSMSVGASGNLLLDAPGGAVSINNTVSDSGAISILARGDIMQAANGDLTGGTSIDVESSAGNIVMANGAVAQSNAGMIRYSAFGNVTLGLLDARTQAARDHSTLTDQTSWGAVSIKAGGSVLDGVEVPVLIDVYANQLRLNAIMAIGSNANALEIEAGTLSASAGTGGMYLLETSSTILDQTKAMSVTRVDSSGAAGVKTDGAQAGLSSGGALVLQTTNGSITSMAGGGLISAAGNLLVQASGAQSAITLNENLISSGGNISLNAGQNIVQGAAITAQTSGKSLDLLAGGAITMSAGSVSSTLNGNILLQAGSDLTLGVVNAGSASVSLNAATGSITNASGVSAVTASGLQLNAATAIGVAGSAIHTTVTTLTASTTAATGGGIFVTDSDGVSVGTVTAGVNRVDATGAVALNALGVLAPVYNIAQSNVVSGSGPVVLISTTGNLTIDSSISVGLSGNLLLDAVSGAVSINNAVSGGGNVSVLASGDITQAASGDISGGASIDVESGSGNIVMANGAVTQNNGGTIRYSAVTGSVTVGVLDTRTAAARGNHLLTDQQSWGAVSIVAGGSILDQVEVPVVTDVYANQLRLNAGAAIGSNTNALETEVATLSAHSATGGTYLLEASSITLGQTDAMSVNRVDGSGASASKSDAVQTGLSSGSTLVLQTTNGSITSTATVGPISAAGNVLLQSTGTLSDISLNASLQSSGGNISLNAARNMLDGAVISTLVGSKTIDVLAGGDVTMSSSAALSSTNGNIVLEAAHSVTVSTVTAGNGSVGIHAGTSILSANAPLTSNDFALFLSSAQNGPLNITASGLQLDAGSVIGAPLDHLNTSVATLAASATGIYLMQTGAVTVGTVSANVNRVSATGVTATTAHIADSGLQGTAGPIVLWGTGGMVFNQAVTASGNISVLSASTDNSNEVDLNSTITAGGDLTVDVEGNLTQQGNISGSGSVAVTAAGRSVMSANSLTTASGNIKYAAGTTLSLAALTSTGGNVSLKGASISNAINGANSNVNVSANQLLLTATDAGGNAGSASNPLQVAVTTLAAQVTGTGGLFVSAAKAIATGAVADVATSLVWADGSTSHTFSDTGLTGITSGGSVSLKAAGSITVASPIGVNAAGNLLLQATGASADVTLNAMLSSTNGNVSLNAGHDVMQAAAIQTLAASDTIDVLAAHNIAMTGTATSLTNAGNLRYAATGGSVTLTSLDGRSSLDRSAGQLNGQAGWGAVSISAATGMVDGVDTGSTVAVYASDLRLNAAAAGLSTNLLSTEVAQISARVGSGGLFVNQASALAIGQTGAISVNRVAFDATTTGASDAAQSGISSGGAVVLAAATGSVTLNASAATDSSHAGLTATGNVLLQATLADVNLQASLLSVSGSVSINAGAAIAQGAAITTQLAGASIDLLAGGDITMASLASSVSNNGNILLQAGGSIVLQTITAGSASVSLNATNGNIVNGGGTLNVTAAGLQLNAASATGAIGAGGTHITAKVANLTANAGAGGMFVTDSQGVALTSFSVNVNRVDTTGVSTLTTNALQSKLLSGGAIVLASTTGDVTLSADVTATGNILLDAVSGALTSSHAIQGGAAISLLAATSITQQNSITGTGSIDLQAGGAIAMSAGVLSTAPGNISYVAGGTLGLGSLSTGANVSVSASAITGSAASANSSGINLTAQQLRLATSGALTGAGAASAHLQVAATTLAASLSGTGGLYMNDASALALDAVAAISVGRVGPDGVSVSRADSASAGVASLGNVVLATTGTLNANASVSGVGQVILSAGTDLSVAGAVSITALGSGNLLLDAQAGSVTMAGTAQAAAAGGNLRLHASNAIMLGSLTAGNVSLVADSGAIAGASGSAANVTAANLRLLASQGIGSAAQALSTSVDTLSAFSTGTVNPAAGSGIYISEHDAVSIGSVAFSASESGLDGTSRSVNDAAQSGLYAGNNGNIVLTTTGGAIGVNSPIAAAGNVLLAASANVTVSAAVSAAGSITLSGGQDVLLQSALSTSVTGSSIEIGAGRQIAMRAGSSLGTVDGNIALNARSGDVSLVALTAGSASVAITATGNIVDLGLENDIVAAGLRLQAGGAIGTGIKPVGIEVTTLTAAASAGDVFISAAGGVTVGALAVAVNHVAPNGAISVVADASQTGLTAAASLVLVSQSGDITINAGVTVTGGNLLLDAVSGAITQNSAITDRTNDSGNISVLAGAGFVQNSSITSGNGSLDVQAGGAITMSASAVSSAANVRYAAGLDLALGQIDATSDAGKGNVSLIAGGAITAVAPPLNVSAAGLRMHAGSAIGTADQVINTAVDLLSADAVQGDIHLRDTDGAVVPGVGVGVTVNRVGALGGITLLTDAAQVGVIAQAGNVYLAASSGAVALDYPLVASPGKDLSIVGDTFLISQLLSGQGGDLTIMPNDPGLNIQIGGSTAAAGSLHVTPNSLANLGSGFGAVVVGSGALAADQDLAINGASTAVVFHDKLLLDVSGKTQISGQLSAQGLDARSAVHIDTSATISSSGAGDLLFEKSIDGSVSGASLTLAADGGNVMLQGAVGGSTPLAGLTISHAANVSFSAPVTVAGNVQINASGIVRFDSSLNFTGGTLTIIGASEVIIGNVVLHNQSGPVVIEANSLTLNGVITGADTVVLRTADAARSIAIGMTGGTDALTISSAALQNLSAVGHLVIGTQGADGHAAAGTGQVAVGAIDFGALTTAPIQIFGGSVTVPAGSAILHAAAGIQFDGRDSVALHSSLASAAGDVSLYSASGAVSMDAGTSITAQANIEFNAAGSLNIGQLHAQNVVLHSTGGTIGGASTDGAVNIVADSVSLYGYGPKVGAGVAVAVQTPSLYVSGPAGMALQDTGPDGRTHFYMLVGASLYEQAIGVGDVARVTQNPAQMLPVRTSAMMAFASPLSGAMADLSAQTAAYLSIGAPQAGATGMGSSVTLGLPAVQTLSTGRAVADTAAFDYWLEDLLV